MPLEKKSSKKAFRKNVKTEVRAIEAEGKSPKKSVKQALAISYATQRDAKKKGK
jgi:hypothetical protein